MKFILLLGFLLFQSCSTYTVAQSLDQHRWKDRLLLVFASDHQNSNFQEQAAILKDNLEGQKDRRLVIYFVTSEGVECNGTLTKKQASKAALLQEFGLENPEFTVILVGLDGGEKLRKLNPITLQELFGVIDRMPMRRNERN